jgi:aspartyl-tRNA(Asn)/glutamyl-tRNA(Gln) amidotransferase subunit C
MAIDRDAIRHLEKLARIELTEEEAAKLTGQLDRIVAFVAELQSVDTEGVPPTRLIGHGSGTPQRPDKVTPGLDRDTVLSQAPDHTDEFFRVPRVLEKEGE